ncbi:MAG: DNA primase [Elusimicrobia bacterium]|jgi:DNA primase|nr:DNA primase [Elusimicrobiota bacterium]
MVEPRDIDRISEYSDIVRLVEEYFPLKKTGANYKALCPFHQEKTPSFVVSPEKQIYHCFGCGKSGNVFNFLMEMEGIEFPEAAKRLAEQAGIKLDTPQNKEYVRRRELNKKIIKLNERAAKFYNKYLKTDAAGKAYNYIKSRGLNEDMIKKFLVGYAPAGNQLVNKALGEGVNKDILLESGLAGQSRGGGVYDKFKDRIIFPIMDERGQVKGFGGRVIDDANMPKYLNTAQTKIFEKKKILYGLKQGKSGIRKSKKILLLEGYMDVIAAHQYNIPYAVAALGTALTSQHIYKIKHWVDEVIFCFDSDDAGAKATVRAVEMVVESDLTGKVCELPEGTDPEDIIRKDRKEFMGLLDNSTEVIDWRIRYSIDKFNDISDRTQKKLKIIRDLAPLINKINGEIKKEEIIKIVSEKIAVGESAVKNEIQKSSRRSQSRGPDLHENKLPLSRDEKICKELLHLALRNESICPDIKEFLKDIDFIENRYLDILKNYLKECKCDITRLIGNSHKDINQEITRLTMQEIKSDSPQDYFRLLKDSLENLRKARDYNKLAVKLKEMHRAGRPVPQDMKKSFSRLARELNRDKTIKIGK